MNRRTFLTVLLASLTGCTDGEISPENDGGGSTQNQETSTQTDISSKIEIVEENTGIDSTDPDDAAPGYHEYEVKNTGQQTAQFYVHVAFYDENGNEVLCNSYFHVLPPGETDGERTNPATINFAEAEIVDIVKNEEAGQCG